MRAHVAGATVPAAEQLAERLDAVIAADDACNAACRAPWENGGVIPTSSARALRDALSSWIDRARA